MINQPTNLAIGNEFSENLIEIYTYLYLYLYTHVE